MARQDSTSEPVVPQARKSIVGYRPNGGRPNPLPQLTIKGRWLEQWGFIKGQPVNIIAEQASADYPHHAPHGGEHMNITFISGPVPQLTITGGELAAFGLTTDPINAA